MIEVVNMARCKDFGTKEGDVRIDRKTKWGNPFYMAKESQRGEVCDKHEKYFEILGQVRHNCIQPIDAERALCALGLSVPTAMIVVRDIAPLLNLVELKDAKRFGCWCAPKQCHGDYLKKRVEEL